LNTNDVKAAREALDSMDDYARMNAGVDAIGPRKVLEDFISMAEDFAVSVPAERAVSPAESVDDPDEPNLRGLLHELVNAVGPKFGRTMNAIFGKFIAYGQKQLEHGRRSALEELHPQWLKEKERADRIEALLREARATLEMWKDVAPAVSLCADIDTVLLSSTAQPLQQEGGKDYGHLPPGVTMRAYRAAHGNAWWISIKHPFGETNHLCTQVRDAQFAELIATSKPSDNLQQASTAQVEPAKEDTFETGYKNLVFVLRCIASGHHNSEELARNVLKHGLLPDTAATPEGADLPQIDYGSERVAFEAAQKYTGLDLTREEHGEYVSYHTHCAWGGWQDRARLATSQQAIAYESEGWTWLQCPHCGSGVKTIQKGAATTAAEPVAWRSALQGLLDRYVGLVVSGDAGNWDAEKEPEVIAARVALAGRAAPPQQVEKNATIKAWRDAGLTPIGETMAGRYAQQEVEKSYRAVTGKTNGSGKKENG